MQYVLQTKNDTKQLIKGYNVSAKCPIRDIDKVHVLNRSQIVIEDENKYNEICNIYAEHKLNAKFMLDEETSFINLI